MTVRGRMPEANAAARRHAACHPTASPAVSAGSPGITRLTSGAGRSRRVETTRRVVLPVSVFPHHSRAGRSSTSVRGTASTRSRRNDGARVGWWRSTPIPGAARAGARRPGFELAREALGSAGGGRDDRRPRPLARSSGHVRSGAPARRPVPHASSAPRPGAGLGGDVTTTDSRHTRRHGGRLETGPGVLSRPGAERRPHELVWTESGRGQGHAAECRVLARRDGRAAAPGPLPTGPRRLSSAHGAGTRWPGRSDRTGWSSTPSNSAWTGRSRQFRYRPNRCRRRPHRAARRGENERWSASVRSTTLTRLDGVWRYSRWRSVASELKERL